MTSSFVYNGLFTLWRKIYIAQLVSYIYIILLNFIYDCVLIDMPNFKQLPYFVIKDVLYFIIWPGWKINKRQNVKQVIHDKGNLEKESWVYTLSTLILHIHFFFQSPVTAGYGNDYLPWLYTQPLQNKGGANVCIVLGKWACQRFINGYIVTKYGCNCLKYIFPREVCIILHSTYVFM